MPYGGSKTAIEKDDDVSVVYSFAVDESYFIHKNFFLVHKKKKKTKFLL